MCNPAIHIQDGRDNDILRCIVRGDRLPLMEPGAAVLGGEWAEATGQLLPAAWPQGRPG